MDEITKKLVEAVNKITNKKHKLPSREEIQKLHVAATDRYKNTKDTSDLPKWFVVQREITESGAFGSGVSQPTTTTQPKTPEEMSDAELEQGTAFGSDGSSEKYKQELRLRYGPRGKPYPPGTPLPPVVPPVPKYLEGKTDAAEYPELTVLHGAPKPTELDKLRYLHRVRPDLAPQPKIIGNQQ